MDYEKNETETNNTNIRFHVPCAPTAIVQPYQELPGQGRLTFPPTINTVCFQVAVRCRPPQFYFSQDSFRSIINEAPVFFSSQLVVKICCGSSVRSKGGWHCLGAVQQRRTVDEISSRFLSEIAGLGRLLEGFGVCYPRRELNLDPLATKSKARGQDGVTPLIRRWNLFRGYARKRIFKSFL